MKIIYFGSDSPLSYHPLKALLRLTQDISTPVNFEICAIVSEHFNTEDISIIDIRAESLQALACVQQIPFIKVAQNLTDITPLLQACKADIILVSCFAQKIPESILSIAHSGGFNIHPSLLPQYRGPDPLFWQFRAEQCVFGVSLHRISAKFDSGNVLFKKNVVMPEGITRHEATYLLAHAAAELAVQLLQHSVNNPPAETPQNSKAMSHQGLPEAKDYVVNNQWTARRLYNFICAYQQVGRYFQCHINQQSFNLTQAFSYQKQPCTEALDLSFKNNPFFIQPVDSSEDNEMGITPYNLRGNLRDIRIACSKGFIHCQFYSEIL